MPNDTSHTSRAACGLIGIALACAALLAVQDTSTSRMLIWPWQLLYWIGPLAAGAALIFSMQSARSRITPAWNWGLVVATVGVILSTAASPYRAQILPWTGWLLTMPALAAAATRLLAGQTDGPRRARLLIACLGVTGTFIAATSLVMWITKTTGQMSLQEDWGDPINHSLRFLLNSRNAQPFGHANYNAGCALLFLPIVTGLAISSRGWRRAAWGIASLLVLAMLFSGGSRGALVGLAALAGLGLILCWKRIPKPLLLAGCIILVGLGLLNSGVRRGLLPPPPDAPVNMSNVQRTAWIKDGLLASAERPILGWGAGSTPWFTPRYRGQLDYGPYTVLQLHNTPLQILAENGVITLLAVLMLAAWITRTGWRMLRRKIDPPAPIVAWSALAALGGYGVFSITDYQLDVPIIAVTLALLAGVVMAQSGDVKPTVNNRAVWDRIGTCIVVLLCIAVAKVAAEQCQLREMLERDDWRPALQLAPDDAALRIYAADRLLHTREGAPADPLKRQEEALLLLDANANKNLIPELTYCLSGWARLDTNPSAARNDFMAALQTAPNHHSALLGLSLASISLGQPDQASHALARACIARPRFLASGWWRLPALDALRPAVINRVLSELDTIAATASLRLSIRNDARYFQAIIRWSEGIDADTETLKRESRTPQQLSFWTQLTSPDEGDAQPLVNLPTHLESVIRLTKNPADPLWPAVIRNKLGDQFPLGKEQYLLTQHTPPELVRGAFQPVAGGVNWPYYQTRATRAGFQVNYRHPRLQGVNDGGVHSENLWADLLLQSLWPDEFWLPDSLLLRTDEN